MAPPTGQRVVQLTSFRLLWYQLVPHVVIGKPKSDLCWVCQRNNSHILRAVNIPEAMKSATLLRQDQHLREATTERIAYQAACAYSKTFAEEHGISELGRSDNPPASFHYSFDVAQQLHYPGQSSTTRTGLLQDAAQDAAVSGSRRGHFTASELLDRRGIVFSPACQSVQLCI